MRSLAGSTRRTIAVALFSATAASFSSALLAAEVIMGPVGPSPYEVVDNWHKPFSAPGFTFGGNSGVWAQTPDRIFVAQRGETRLPEPLPAEFAGFAGSIGINVLTDDERRTWQNCLYVLDGDGNLLENWSLWDHLCQGSEGPGPHRVRISPYDPQQRVWVINESSHSIDVLSNDGSQLLMSLGERNVPGDDRTHFAKPQDVAFLPDGRVLVALNESFLMPPTLVRVNPRNGQVMQLSSFNDEILGTIDFGSYDARTAEFTAGAGVKVAGQPGGPQNFSICRGSVYASHTRSREAAKSATTVRVSAAGSFVTVVIGMAGSRFRVRRRPGGRPAGPPALARCLRSDRAAPGPSGSLRGCRVPTALSPAAAW